MSKFGKQHKHKATQDEFDEAFDRIFKTRKGPPRDAIHKSQQHRDKTKYDRKRGGK